ncbi:MAG: putative CAMK family protein kinase [Streblomastix strix]|uniref:Putative CAMK family protein kinase n=1 Tax=Streblomastix strix TaxID=222440 RepID=A0A5J4WBR9_9EUKA|nr:MAG: putative CAMK family protein kinase [Streblomastix strix]
MEQLRIIVLQGHGFQACKGQFRHVFKVQKEEFGIIAAKVMNEDEFQNYKWRQDIQKIIGNTNPFALKYISKTTYGLNTVVLMEYSNLNNLNSLIETNKDIPIPIIRTIMRQILEGLRLIHEKGLFHGDINSNNILLHNPAGSGRVIVKIADLGLIKVQKYPLQSTKMTSVGTIPYQPPEMIIGNEDDKIIADAKIDVWSSGIIFYQFVSHSFPFKSTNLQSIIMFMLSKTLERPPQVKDYILWDLLTKMLAFDKKDRISASDALNHEFFTGQQAMSEISKDVRNLALTAQTTKSQGNNNVTQYDTNSLFVIPLRLIKQILSEGPDNISSPKQCIMNQFGGASSTTSLQQLQDIPLQQSESLAIDEEQSQASQNLMQRNPLQISSSQYQITQQNNKSYESTIDIQKIVKILKLPLDGTEQQNNKTQQLQIAECLNIMNRLKDKEDDEQRTEIINVGVTQQLQTIFETRGLLTITPPFIEAFLCITFPYSWEMRNQIYKKKNPYPGLFRLLDHDDIEVVRLVIRSIGMKDASAICIGRLFYAKEIPDKNIKQEVISHLKSIINNSDKWTRESAKDALQYLAQSNDEELRKSIINSGIVESLFFVFQSRVIESITVPYIELFFHITSPCNDDIISLLYTKQPYPYLMFLLNHPDTDVIHFALVSIQNLLLTGTKTTAFSPLHPHYELINQYNGIEKLFLLSQCFDVGKRIRDDAAICISSIYRTGSITNQAIRTEIISHLISLLEDSDEWLRNKASIDLGLLAQNSGTQSPSSPKHPHFDEIMDCNGIKKLYSLFLKNKINKIIRDSTAICIGSLFKTQEIPKPMRIAIITHLKQLLQDIGKWI